MCCLHVQVCGHVYDPVKDGNGLPFEQLPDSWKCPVCGAPKSAYQKVVDGTGRVRWVHEEKETKAADTYKCSVRARNSFSKSIIRPFFSAYFFCCHPHNCHDN